MELSDITAGTPKVLDHCLELLLQLHISPMRSSRSAPVTPAKYASHPDIQFFRLVKAKHHYAYHKLKAESETANEPHRDVLTSFDPYSRELLLKRLKTYNALNWNVPPNDVLTELTCATHGWVCESISRNNNTKNHLRCSGCGNEIILRYNSIENQPMYAPFQFDLADIAHLNNNLTTQYLNQIQLSGHLLACSWTKVHTPVSGVYYLTPYVSATNDALISSYLHVLRNLTDNFPILAEHATSLRALSPNISVENLTELVSVSNKWLLARYFHDNKENMSQVLQRLCLPWLYWLAAMGWDLNVQTFASQTVLLLICSSCNQRVFVKLVGSESNESDHELNIPLLSSSKILTPCKFPPHHGHQSTGFSTEYMDEMDTEDSQDANLGHKPWCSHIQKIGTNTFFEYFSSMIIGLENNIGPQGEYLYEHDHILDMDSSAKRRNSMDVGDGLERLTKLRKLYFVN